MRTPRALTALWIGVVGVLLVIEIAQITRFFTLPIQSALANPLVFISALVFTTVLALVGAIFIGIYISHRILSSGGFTPFEEEMLKMRSEVRELARTVRSLSTRTDEPAEAPREERP
ncbi:MAG: hypothetical protein ACYCPV_00520 [Thermoplasmata archaeon]|jgi:hypothetical protein